MGWFSEDAPPGHEGYAAYVLPDGRSAGSSTLYGVLPDPTSDVVVPWSELAGWQTRCDCGWAGRRWERVDTTPGKYDGHDPEDAYLDDGHTVEDLAYEDWSAHIAPLTRAAAIREAAAEFTAARGRLDRAVQAARSASEPLSWAEIGQAAGITRQAAHERWGRPRPESAEPRLFGPNGLLTGEASR